MKTFNKLFQGAKARERESRKDQGFFDGRFRHRVVPNKKKKELDKLSRKKISIYE